MSSPIQYHVLFIIGNNGNMIFQKIFNKELNFNINDCLQIASTLFTINDLTSLIIPDDLVVDDEDNCMENLIKYRLENVETDKFNINYYNSLTNIKIILISNSDTSAVINILKKIYFYYSDIIGKDPFYANGQPIKNNYFEECVNKLFTT